MNLSYRMRENLRAARRAEPRPYRCHAGEAAALERRGLVVITYTRSLFTEITLTDKGLRYVQEQLGQP